ncbi:hypothetical protein HUT19_21445 [Streptomyces sp. NA02950]|uniref:FtsK/SpoIIIE domain-containing protein n=1 Tax=Streptomyces sp. NA02950 TaxID=2742137 RepID=UPI001591A395|nr:FtsK/SpoIIIE domain-containing protein [Streptomyces sp. NA02950]QKV94005.1 hypothetical protein HUT19_21445 [Streptomyces sp. NA02950]
MTTTTGTTTGKKQQAEQGGPVLDWAAGHGPVTGALSATTGAFALATTGAATGMPPGWALAAGCVGAIGHTAAGLRWRNAGRTITARAASWLLGSGWTTWAITHGPLTWTALGSLATIGIGIGTAARATGLYEEAREDEAAAAVERQVAAELSAERRGIAAEWAERIERIASIRLRVLAVEMWATGCGFTIDAELPGGTTYDHIAKHSARLGADAHLPHGCTVAAGPGIHQGRVLIDVATASVLEQEISYPSDYGPLSVHTGIPWGVRTTAEQVLTYLREQCALVVGPTGSGKTNMLHTILAGFARATDVITWVIDLNAGSAGLPWVRPALQPDGTPVKDVRPGVDWLAGSHEEAVRMLDAAIRIGRHRKTVYQDLMAQANTDLLPISAQIPQIMLVIDEGAEILVSNDRNTRKLAEKILEVIRLFRAMGIRTVLTALGATGSVLGNLMIRREAKVRVALTGGETEGMDLSKQFPGSRGLRTDQAPYKGSGFMGTPESPVALFKSWRILPNQIRDIVAATSDRHPTLDAKSAQAAGAVYADRWDRERTAWMREHAPAEPTPDATSDPAVRSGAGAGLNLSALRDGGRDAGPGDDPDADRLAQQFMREIDERFGTTPDPDAEQDAKQQRPERAQGGLNLSALRDSDDADETAAAGPEWLAEAIKAIQSAGAAGMKPSAVADLVGRSRQAVRDALKAAAERGELVYRDNGPHSVYVHPDHA